ncbi:hypothetical protein ACFQ3W_00895 [Paenibacillus puldeungensis]|uniref:Uncharacterized protein n=1 Tax=Paenibacillus puldeungensis TaxID=696536 RepID=A0ABW3RRF2_9BACL
MRRRCRAPARRKARAESLESRSEQMGRSGPK